MASADDKSFESMALPHLDILYRVARRLARSDHEAEDLVQETYLKAYKAFGTYQEREFGIKPWLLKILNNTFLNRAAREKKAPKTAEQSALEQAPAIAPVVPPELDYETLDEEVKAALDRLTPEFRTVLLLWATNEMSYQEIADTLGLPIGTVMSRLHRARQQLAGALQDFARENRISQVKYRP
jgi:RNA polymerase sigma-70 factor (ECF subfamily)